jgi:hypothetical protein
LLLLLLLLQVPCAFAGGVTTRVDPYRAASCAVFPPLSNPYCVVLMLLLLQVPCAFAGGVTTRVDSYRASGGGWVRLTFKNVNGGPLEKVELAKVRTSGIACPPCTPPHSMVKESPGGWGAVRSGIDVRQPECLWRCMVVTVDPPPV